MSNRNASLNVTQIHSTSLKGTQICSIVSNVHSTLFRTQGLKSQLPQQSNGSRISCWSSNHPAANLNHREMKGLLQQLLLNTAFTKGKIRAKQFRELQHPAAAAAVKRTGYDARNGASALQGHQTARRAAGQQVREALLEARQPIPEQEGLESWEVIQPSGPAPLGEMAWLVPVS